MKIIFKILLFALFVPLFLIALLVIWLKLTPFAPTDLPELKNGDIIFQSNFDAQSLGVSLASSSVYTHTGIIKLNPGFAPIVVEAIGPVIETPLNDWIGRGIGSRVSIARVKNLAPEAAAAALTESRKYYGLPYDIYFLPGDEQIYCSELVYNSYLRGSNITLGRVEKVSDLNTDNFAVRNVIEQRWRSYPLCADIKDYAACYKIIMAQELVTPATIAKDDKVEMIYSNYGLLK